MKNYTAVFLGGANHGVSKLYKKEPPERIALIDHVNTSWLDDDTVSMPKTDEYVRYEKIERHDSDQITLVYTYNHRWYSTEVIANLIDLASKKGALQTMPE